MTLDNLYLIAAQDNSLAHAFTTLLAVCAPEAELWRPQIRTFLAAISKSYPAAFPALYARLSGEERETLRLIYDTLHAPESPRYLLYQRLGIDLTTAVDDHALPAFVRDWQAWWQASATVKPLPETLGAFAIAHPVIEVNFLGQIFPPTDLFLAFRETADTQQDQWEAVLQPYTARLDLIAQGTRQALRQWQTLQDRLLFSLTDNKDE